jgi:hypothetical protein
LGFQHRAVSRLANSSHDQIAVSLRDGAHGAIVFSIVTKPSRDMVFNVRDG